MLIDSKLNLISTDIITLSKNNRTIFINLYEPKECIFLNFRYIQNSKID